MKKLRGVWRAVGAAMILVAIPAAASCEEGEKLRPSLLVGGTYSTGLGEKPFAPYVEARMDLGGWRLSSQGELSRKVESSSGYRLGLDLERRVGPLLVLAAYRERNGGAWSKRGVWVGGGLGSQALQLRLRQEIGGNQTRAASVTVAVGRVEVQGAVYQFRPSFGGPRQVGGTFLLGARVGG